MRGLFVVCVQLMTAVRSAERVCTVRAIGDLLIYLTTVLQARVDVQLESFSAIDVQCPHDGVQALISI